MKSGRYGLACAAGHRWGTADSHEAREPEPLTPEQVDYWRGQIAARAPAIQPWPDSEVVTLVARLVATLDAARADTGELARLRHPGEPHEFRASCQKCGEPGMVNLTILAPGETVRVVEPEPFMDELGRRSR